MSLSSDEVAARLRAKAAEYGRWAHASHPSASAARLLRTAQFFERMAAAFDAEPSRRGARSPITPNRLRGWAAECERDARAVGDRRLATEFSTLAREFDAAAADWEADETPAAADITLVGVPVMADEKDCEGHLVLANGTLAAVVVRFAIESHGALQGRWFVEAAFGSLAPAVGFMFADLKQLRSWAGWRLGRAARALGG